MRRININSSSFSHRLSHWACSWHALRHGATDGAFSCRVCDFNHNNRDTFFKHLERHRVQGNVSEHLLTLSRAPVNAKRGINIGDADEVAIVGNENDFEIEYGLQDEDFLSDSEIMDVPVEDAVNGTITLH